jgi:hypothetical protein
MNGQDVPILAAEHAQLGIMIAKKLQVSQFLSALIAKVGLTVATVHVITAAASLYERLH